jgi:hypothetical protein
LGTGSSGCLEQPERRKAIAAILIVVFGFIDYLLL